LIIFFCIICRDPTSQLNSLAYGKARGLDLRDDYLIYTCWAARIQDPEECPVEDLRQCLTFLQDNLGIDFDITELYDEITSDANTKGFLKAVCIAASENDVESVKELFESLDAEIRQGVTHPTAQRIPEEQNQRGSAEARCWPPNCELFAVGRRSRAAPDTGHEVVQVL